MAQLPKLDVSLNGNGVVKLVAGNYNLVVKNSSLNTETSSEVRIICDTKLGPIDITLPSIKSFNRLFGAKIFIVDLIGNAKDITINGFVSDAEPIQDVINGNPKAILAFDKGVGLFRIGYNGIWGASNVIGA